MGKIVVNLTTNIRQVFLWMPWNLSLASNNNATTDQVLRKEIHSVDNLLVVDEDEKFKVV